MSKQRCLMFGTNIPGGMRTVIEIYQQCEIAPELDFEFVPSHVAGGGAKWVPAFVAAIWLLIKRMLLRRVDVVHVHVASYGSFWRKVILGWLANLGGVPAIFHLHGSEFKVFYVGLPPVLQRLATRAMNGFDQVIVLSPSWAEWMAKEAGVDPAKLVVLRNFVLPQAFDSSQRSVAPLFLFMGLVGDRKGTFDLIRAFASMDASIRGRLLIAGNGEVPKAQALIDELGVGQDVEMLGWVGPEQRRSLLETANIFVLPSYNEGQPMSIAEAMSARLPVISTYVGGIPDQVVEGEQGFLFNPGDLEALNASMRELASNEVLRKRMGDRAKERYDECFSPAAGLPILQSVYEALITSRSETRSGS